MARKGGKDRGILFRPRPHGEVIGPKGRRGEWYARYWTADGQEKREKGGTKSMALDLYRRRKTEVLQGVKFPESMRTRDVRLKDLMAEYLEAVKASQAKTADAIERRLNMLVGILGNVPAKNIKAEDLERLKIKLTTGTRTLKQKDGTEKPITRKPATINRFLQDLKAVFCKAVDCGKLDRNPFNGVELLTENNKRSRDLTPDEEFRLFKTLPNDPPALRPYFRFLLATGARASEACALTRRAISEADGVAELPETKAGHKQHLTLSAEAMSILRDLPRIGPLLFCWPDGRPFTVDYTTHALHRATVAASIPDLRQHDLRHAFAIRRLRGGANLVAVSALLRHASTRMSERYLHVTRADLRAAVEAGAYSPTGTPTGTEVDTLLQTVENTGHR